MEGVGARLGRSSTRYGPTTVFTGPVRKWKKKWVHVSPSSSSSAAASHSNGGNNTNNNNAASHLLLYKWSPVTSNNKGDDSSPSAAAEEALPKPKKFKYVPIAVLEEERKEEMEEVDEEAKPSETDQFEGPTSKSDGTDGKPDMNDVPMEEAQVQAPDMDHPVQQDLNETSLDLSLGIKGHDGDCDSDSKLESPSKG